MKHIHIKVLLLVLINNTIFGCASSDSIHWNDCNFTSTNEQFTISDACLLMKHKNALNTIQNQLHLDKYQLSKYTKEYNQYTQELETKVSSYIAQKDMYEFEIYLNNDKEAQHLFERVSILKAHLIPSMQTLVSDKQDLALDLEQNIWKLSQKQIQHKILLSEDEINGMYTLIDTAEAIEKSEIKPVIDGKIARAKEQIFNTMRNKQTEQSDDVTESNNTKLYNLERILPDSLCFKEDMTEC